MMYTENRDNELYTLVYDYDDNGEFIGCHMEKKTDVELVSYDIRKIAGTTKTGKTRTISVDVVTRCVNNRRNYLKCLRTFYNKDNFVIRKVL